MLKRSISPTKPNIDLNQPFKFPKENNENPSPQSKQHF